MHLQTSRISKEMTSQGKDNRSEPQLTQSNRKEIQYSFPKNLHRKTLNSAISPDRVEVQVLIGYSYLCIQCTGNSSPFRYFLVKRTPSHNQRAWNSKWKRMQTRNARTVITAINIFHELLRIRILSRIYSSRFVTVRSSRGCHIVSNGKRAERLSNRLHSVFGASFYLTVRIRKRNTPYARFGFRCVLIVLETIFLNCQT